VYLVATALCFACSTLYHLFADHVWESSWLRLDHFGIVCAIWASSISFILFSFDCRQGERRAYAACITLAAILSLVRLSGIRPYHLTSRRSRIGTHMLLGGLAVLPGLRHWHLHASDRHAGLLTNFWGLIITNSIGGGIYATHLLDKAMGMDLGLPDMSHHVMHVMVVAGAWIYERGLLSTYQTRAAGVLGPCI
jgi:adiponectin receptor